MVDRDDAVEQVTQVEVVPPPPDPGAFTPGSFTPASEGLSIRERIAQAKGSVPTPPRGRPASAKTEAKATPRRRAAPEPTPVEAKRARAADIAENLTGEVNDTVLSFFVSQGMPPGAIWRSGQVPIPVGDMSKYTPNGAKLAIDGFTARAVASFIAELEGNASVSKATEAVTGGVVGLVLKGILAGACVVGYTRGVLQVVGEMQQLRRQIEEYRAQQPQNQREATPIYGLN